MKSIRYVAAILLLLCLLAACQKTSSLPATTSPATAMPSTPTSSQIPTPPMTITPPGTTQPTTLPTASEAGAPEEARVARDAVIFYLSEHDRANSPAAMGPWAEERATPQGLVGSETYRYTARDWIIIISYPVVAPDMAVYRVVAANQVSGFTWQGEVDAAGKVTEGSAQASDPVLAARDAVLAHLNERYQEQAPERGLTWTRARTTPEGLVGVGSYQYRAGYWVINVSYPILAPRMVVYKVLVSNEGTGFQWQGEVDATGQVTETRAASSGKPVIGWYGQLNRLPAGDQFDDYFRLEPEGSGEFGLSGADVSIEAQIESLRDSGAYAHIWGTLVCGVADYKGCEILVTRLRPEGTEFPLSPDPVEGWEGTVSSLPAMAQYDDYFVLAGDLPIRYGIASGDPSLARELESLRDTRTVVRLWGRLTCGVPDVNASQIDVIAFEVAGGSSSTRPTEVEGWVGTVVALAPGSQYHDYFARADGEQFGLGSTDPKLEKRIEALRTTGERVRVWGQLLNDVPDVQGRQIQVERLELESESGTVDGWTGAVVKLPPGAEYDDYFARVDGQRFGLGSTQESVQQEIESLRWTGAQVKVWGELLDETPDVEGRQIQVERLEAVSAPATEPRNLSFFASALASSALAPDEWGAYDVGSAVDGVVETPWVEGVEGPGVGQWLLLTFPGPIELERIGFGVGYDRTETTFANNNRLKKAILSFSNGEQVELTLSDTRGIQTIPLVRAPAAAIQTSSVKVTIAEVYPGSKYNDTCIGEIEVWGRTK